MARFYALELSEDLFGQMWLERRWGRIGTLGQMKLELIEKDLDPSKRIDVLARQKTRRGYQPR